MQARQVSQFRKKFADLTPYSLLEPDQVVFMSNLFFKINVSLPLVTG